MSRYRIEPNNNNANLEVIVGYVQPLDTFFAQVFDLFAKEVNDTEDARIIYCVGTKPQEITHVWQLAQLIEPFAALKDQIIVRLIKERTNGQFHKMTPLGEEMQKLIVKMKNQNNLD